MKNNNLSYIKLLGIQKNGLTDCIPEDKQNTYKFS